MEDNYSTTVEDARKWEDYRQRMEDPEPDIDRDYDIPDEEDDDDYDRCNCSDPGCPCRGWKRGAL
jgi:hypothetical protein